MIIYFQFLQVARYSLFLVGINIFVIWCMDTISIVQMIAWEDELLNLTNSTTVIQYELIQNSIIGCLLITCLTIQILFVCIKGFDKFIKLFREITWKRWIFMACLIIIIVVIISLVNIPTERLDTFIKKICKKMVFGTDINGNLSVTLPKDGYLPPGIYYTFYCALCVNIWCNIQHIIIIALIIKIRPKNFVWYMEDNSNKNSSKPLSHSSTAQAQTISVKESKSQIVP